MIFIKHAERTRLMPDIPVPQAQVIDTNDPETEVWERIGYFESESYATNFRDARIVNPILKARCQLFG